MIKEKTIQDYIWSLGTSWVDLIEPIIFPPKYEFSNLIEDIFCISPSKIIYNHLIDRLYHLNEQIRGLTLFGNEVPLKKAGDSTIRADLLGIFDSVAGIGIIEIKKSNQTERQAYTELLAYASHLQSLFPMMCKDDIVYILIAPMEERIVREASIQKFLFDEKPVFALIPKYNDNDIRTLKLIPWIPDIKDIIKLAGLTFSPNSIEVVKIVWDFIPEWNAEPYGSPSVSMIKRMNNISAHTAQIMEAKGMHGFTFSSQSYSELPFLPNSIILAAINPFKVAKSYYLVNNLGLNISEINEVRDDEINLLDLIPELKGKSKQLNEENEFFHYLSVNWANTLYKMGFEIVDLIKKSASSDYYVDFDSSCMTWAEYQILPIEDIHCFNYDARTTGLLRKICTEYLREDYQFLSKFGCAEHPHYNEGDMPNYLIDAVNNQGFFRDFLKRLFYQIEDEIDM